MLESELEAILANDDSHWWYRGRRRILHQVLGRIGPPAGGELLDAGCGSGRTLDDLAAYGQATGVDISPAAVAASRARGHRAVIAPVERLPFATAAFDVVTCMDVLEHTQDDRVTLGELRRVTRPGGHLVVTVPAYQFLFSAHDRANDHYRRYRRPSLHAAGVEAGWTTVSSTHFNAVLLPPAALVRLARRRAQPTPGHSELHRTPAWLDALLELPLRVEAAILTRGGTLPAGLSVLAVLRNDEPAVRALSAARRGPDPLSAGAPAG